MNIIKDGFQTFLILNTNYQKLYNKFLILYINHKNLYIRKLILYLNYIFIEENFQFYI